MANPKIKKAVSEIEGVQDEIPTGTPFSHLTPERLRAQYAHVFGFHPDGLTFKKMIENLLFQFELQKTQDFQDSVYEELKLSND